MASTTKRVSVPGVLLGVVLGGLLVLLTAPAAVAGGDPTDSSSTSNPSTTSVSGGKSTETIVKVETEKNTDDIVRWGGLGVVAILAIALIWFFFVRDRSASAEE
jgi:hypothetical protein